jgi:hypothetical protein
MVIGVRVSVCAAGGGAVSARVLSSMVKVMVEATVVVRKLRRLNPGALAAGELASGERFVVLIGITSAARMRHIRTALLHPRKVEALRPSSCR